GLKPAVFFKMPRKDFILNDIVKGEVIFKEGSIGDFVLLRSNGLPTYNFACVVDDSLMEITHVIRGDDHLSNTLRQLAIYEALQKKPPKFAHVSMILGPDGKKLSKRFGATSVEEFRDKGYLPQALANYLVLLGWSHPEGKEILSKEEMIEAFSLDRLSKNPAIFDPAKLRWMNAHYIRSLETEELVKISKPFLEKVGYRADEKYIAEILDMVKDRLEVLEELPYLVEYFFKDPEPTPIHGDLMKRTFEKLLEELEKIDWEKNNIVEAFKKTVKEMKIKAKDFYMTLRIILTGREEGPELVRLVPALGKEKVIRRLKKSLEVSL
ncbi:MAG TPA: glutamate--tRNA ligase, partial [Thermotoga sp.]|nr:glutamate--tRNA ligase [Thermotoga sp.]